nr:MAG TPA: hypothetical protein [Caudoviricetes sp.]
MYTLDKKQIIKNDIYICSNLYIILSYVYLYIYIYLGY